MKFRLDKTRLSELLKAFRQDKLPKSQRKREKFHIDDLFARIEALEGIVSVHSGRVRLDLKASVDTKGCMRIRDSLFRNLLLTLKGEAQLAVEAGPGTLRVNGAEMTLPHDDYQCASDPSELPVA